MSPEELPNVYQTDLEPAAYLALLDDLAALPLLEVSVKADARTFVPERAAVSLDAARVALDAGQIRAMQVRYVFDGATWIDTIMRIQGGLRLVRVQAQAAAPHAHGSTAHP